MLHRESHGRGIGYFISSYLKVNYHSKIIPDTALQKKNVRKTRVRLIGKHIYIYQVWKWPLQHRVQHPEVKTHKGCYKVVMAWRSFSDCATAAVCSIHTWPRPWHWMFGGRLCPWCITAPLSPSGCCWKSIELSVLTYVLYKWERMLVVGMEGGGHIQYKCGTVTP